MSVYTSAVPWSWHSFFFSYFLYCIYFAFFLFCCFFCCCCCFYCCCFFSEQGAIKSKKYFKTDKGSFDTLTYTYIWSENIVHMNLSYELTEHIKRKNRLSHFDGQRQQWHDPCHCWLLSWPFNVNHVVTLVAMVLRRQVFNLRNALNDRSAEHRDIYHFRKLWKHIKWITLAHCLHHF